MIHCVALALSNMTKYVLYIFLGLGLILSACNPETDTASLAENSRATIVFNALDAKAQGLDFTNALQQSAENNILEYLYYYNGGGVAIGDINNDGLEDIYLTANESSDKLFLNEGNLKFRDITQESGINTSSSWSSGVSMDDVNGDGLLDIYVCKVDPVNAEITHNLLYINNGNLGFTEQAKDYGLDFSGYSTQASFLDYDKDGDLDMYLANHSVHSVRSYGRTDLRTKKDALAGDRFYENQLNESAKKFIDVTDKVGIYSSSLGYALSVISADINRDGYPDIYVANDFHENDYIYINNKNSTFTESIVNKMPHASKFSMGVDISDMNGDGLADIFTTDMLPYDKGVALRSGGEDTDEVFKIRTDFGYQYQYARNHFQLQTEDGAFSDIALMTNTYATDWSWSVLLQDFDNNGLNDIFITNGIVKRPNDLDYINFLNQLNPTARENISDTSLEEILGIMPSEKLSNLLFTQTSPLSFSELKESKVGQASFSNGAAYSDLDNDGDLDIIVNNINDPVSILENKSTDNHYISFHLRSDNGTVKNSRVRLFVAGEFMEKSYITTRGYQSSSSHKIHFGLGAHTSIDSALVYWTDGSVQKLDALEIDKQHNILKADSKTFAAQIPSGAKARVSELNFRHLENPFSDYNEDKLIPELLSREGPAVVKADFNGDNIDDLYIGGARFQEAKYYLGTKGGGYKAKESKDFAVDAKYEDVDAASIDFDKDGDLDLYVVSGGNDVKELNKLLEDRVYLNDGKGNLKRLPLSLPHTNGSTVSIADVDKDGFEDIFVGARSIPTAYGLSPYSFTLKNKGGFGVDILDKKRYGMVTDSEWADMDNDGDLDLVLCGDWMDIKILENDGNGKLTTQINALPKTSGLWNTVQTLDINQDGKLDIIAGNAGSNFKWTASDEHPVEMYVADFDGNGQVEHIIFADYFSESKIFPSLDKLSGQIPSIKKQFLKYNDYSGIQKISDFEMFKEASLAETKKMTELRSMLYLATESGYEAIALPFEAQMSTIQDFYVDENNTIYFVGNHHEYLTELGKSLSNSGGILSGFDAKEKSFTSYTSLPLPPSLNSREIIRLGKNKFLVAPNNDKPLIIDLPKK